MSDEGCIQLRAEGMGRIVYVTWRVVVSERREVHEFGDEAEARAFACQVSPIPLDVWQVTRYPTDSPSNPPSGKVEP